MAVFATYTNKDQISPGVNSNQHPNNFVYPWIPNPRGEQPQSKGIWFLYAGDKGLVSQAGAGGAGSQPGQDNTGSACCGCDGGGAAVTPPAAGLFSYNGPTASGSLNK